MLRSDRVMLSVMCVFEVLLAVFDFACGKSMMESGDSVSAVILVFSGIFASLSVAFGCAVLIRTTWRR